MVVVIMIKYVYDDHQETGSNMGSELEKDARSFFGGLQSHHCWPSEMSMSFHEHDDVHGYAHPLARHRNDPHHHPHSFY